MLSTLIVKTNAKRKLPVSVQHSREWEVHRQAICRGTLPRAEGFGLHDAGQLMGIGLFWLEEGNGSGGWPRRAVNRTVKLLSRFSLLQETKGGKLYVYQRGKK